MHRFTLATLFLCVVFSALVFAQEPGPVNNPPLDQPVYTPQDPFFGPTVDATPQEVYFPPTSDVTPNGPFCINGVIESNGVCNCYSAWYSNDSSVVQCNVPAPSTCTILNQTDSLANDYVPWWGTADVHDGNQLSWSFYSNLVAGRRTIVEMPNPQCNFLVSPQYFRQAVSAGCIERFDMTFPFTECGFTATYGLYSDLWRGTIVVKQIDRITVGGVTTDRVIETPFGLWVEMRKQLWVQSDLVVNGPPDLGVDAAFVGQTVNAEARSGSLQYLAAVKYPMQIQSVEIVDVPSVVDAWVEIVTVNCTDNGPCVQRLDVHFNLTLGCYFSGTYRLAVSLGCRSDQGCPDVVKNGTKAYIESRIVAQTICPEVGVDIDLNGDIQMYSDPSFTSPALAFYPGQTAYFLINAYSSRVNLANVTFDYVSYSGPNVDWNYLYVNENPTWLAAAANMAVGSRGNSQAWFSLDVDVTTPTTPGATIFRLYPGQTGVYNFVAVMHVEWYVTTGINQPVGVPTTVKKRMILQGSVANQGSQFAAQVQISGPTPSVQQTTPVSDPVSSSVSIVASWSVVVVALTYLVLF